MNAINAHKTQQSNYMARCRLRDAIIALIDEMSVPGLELMMVAAQEITILED